MDQVYASATYLMPGEDLTINAGIGAYSSKATPNVSVNGAPAVRTPQGDYEIKTKAETSPGQYVKHVVITYTDPNDGKVRTVTKDIKYTVGSPTGASVSADAVKVLYIGLDNPISVSGGNVGDERITFNINNGSFTKDKPGHYIVRPGKPGTADITLSIDGKPQVFPFRVKNVPDPVAMVGASKGETMGHAKPDFALAGLRTGALGDLGPGSRLQDQEFQLVAHRGDLDRSGRLYGGLDPFGSHPAADHPDLGTLRLRGGCHRAGSFARPCSRGSRSPAGGRPSSARSSWPWSAPFYITR